MAALATIGQVARLAGVSPATVSRVLNGTKPVGDAARQRVLAAVQQLGYRPNPLARGLASGRSEVIALVVPDLANPYFATVAAGVEEVAAARGYSLVLANTRGEVDRELAQLASLQQQKVAGAVFMTRRLRDEHRAFWSRHRFPVVLAGRHDPRGQVPGVTVEDRRGAADATRHLIELGHRRIGFISGMLTDDAAGAARLQGYREALAGAGIDPDPALEREGDFHTPSGYREARELLTLAHPPTAIFAANDEMALGALAAAADLGRSVPGDVSVVGYDDLPLLQMVRPGITTVHQPIAELGARAGRLLFGLLAGERPHRQVWLEHRLVIRQSTAAPGCAAPG